MTYCLGIKVDAGLVLVSDSRTNAGADNVSTYSKMRRFNVPGLRHIVLCSAGNLATTQTVYSALERDIKEFAPRNLNTVTSMEEAQNYVGELSTQAQNQVTGGGPVFEASFLLGGEIAGDSSQLMLVYPEGNHINSSRQTPFLQIGESKYGKPILDRVLTMSTPLEHAALSALVSMDATMRSNVSVAPPIELSVYASGSLQPDSYGRFTEEGEYLAEIRTQWDALIGEAFTLLPAVDWQEGQQDIGR